MSVVVAVPEWWPWHFDIPHKEYKTKGSLSSSRRGESFVIASQSTKAEGEREREIRAKKAFGRSVCVCQTLGSALDNLTQQPPSRSAMETYCIRTWTVRGKDVRAACMANGHCVPIDIPTLEQETSLSSIRPADDTEGRRGIH